MSTRIPKAIAGDPALRKQLADLIQVRNESVLASRARLRAGLGGTGEGGDRDYLAELRYPRAVTVQTYRDWWENDGLANRVVGVYPDECWAPGPEVYDTEDDRRTRWQREYDEFDRVFDPLGVCRAVDELSGIGGYGAVVLSLRDGLDPSRPAAGVGPDELPEPGGRPDVELAALIPLDQTQCRVKEYDQDPRSPRAGWPTLYGVRLGEPTEELAAAASVQSVSGREVDVHWTRVVHAPNDLTSPSRVAGVPRLKGVFHRVFDVRWKIAGGSAEMFWQGALPGYAFEENEPKDGLDTVPLDKATLDQEFDLFLNRLQRYLAVQGGKVKSLAPQVADPASHLLQQLLLICAAIKCPLRTFLGSEQGHLASEQDQARWNKRVMGRCLRHCDRVILRKLLTRLMAAGPLPWTNTLLTSWKDVATSTEKDVAEVAMKTTQSLLQYITSGAFLLVPPKEYMTLVLRWDPRTADAVLKKAGGADRLVAQLKEMVKKPNAQNSQERPGATGSGGKRNGLGA